MKFLDNCRIKHRLIKFFSFLQDSLEKLKSVNIVQYLILFSARLKSYKTVVTEELYHKVLEIKRNLRSDETTFKSRLRSSAGVMKRHCLDV